MQLPDLHNLLGEDSNSEEVHHAVSGVHQVLSHLPPSKVNNLLNTLQICVQAIDSQTEGSMSGKHAAKLQTIQPHCPTNPLGKGKHRSTMEETTRNVQRSCISGTNPSYPEDFSGTDVKGNMPRPFIAISSSDRRGYQRNLEGTREQSQDESADMMCTAVEPVRKLLEFPISQNDASYSDSYKMLTVAESTSSMAFMRPQKAKPRSIHGSYSHRVVTDVAYISSTAPPPTTTSIHANKSSSHSIARPYRNKEALQKAMIEPVHRYCKRPRAKVEQADKNSKTPPKQLRHECIASTKSKNKNVLPNSRQRARRPPQRTDRRNLHKVRFSQPKVVPKENDVSQEEEIFESPTNEDHVAERSTKELLLGTLVVDSTHKSSAKSLNTKSGAKTRATASKLAYLHRDSQKTLHKSDFMEDIDGVDVKIKQANSNSKKCPPTPGQSIQTEEIPSDDTLASIPVTQEATPCQATSAVVHDEITPQLDSSDLKFCVETPCIPPDDKRKGNAPRKRGKNPLDSVACRLDFQEVDGDDANYGRQTEASITASSSGGKASTSFLESKKAEDERTYQTRKLSSELLHAYERKTQLTNRYKIGTKKA